jgi:VCBS repeat protein
MVDLDQDGDLDLLMTNGDSLDDFTVRPFHGVRWFENDGSYPWKQHDLAVMPGVHRAQAADIDGDGDLDVVATAFLPNAEHPAFQLLERQGNLAPFTGLGWIEQVKPGVFVPHPIEDGKLTHTTLDLGDVDGDGDVDVVTGNFVGFTFAKSDTGFKADGSVDLWLNQRKP